MHGKARKQGNDKFPVAAYRLNADPISQAAANIMSLTASEAMNTFANVCRRELQQTLTKIITLREKEILNIIVSTTDMYTSASDTSYCSLPYVQL